MATALVTGMVVANWTGRQADDPKAVKAPPQPAQPAASPPTAVALAPAPAAPVAVAPAPVAQVPAAPARPSQSVIEECNRAASQPTTKDKTVEVVKDSAVA